MLKQVFGDVLGQSQTNDWFEHFKEGWTLIDDDSCSGHPSTGIISENVATDHPVIIEDLR